MMNDTVDIFNGFSACGTAESKLIPWYACSMSFVVIAARGRLSSNSVRRAAANSPTGFFVSPLDGSTSVQSSLHICFVPNISLCFTTSTPAASLHSASSPLHTTTIFTLSRSLVGEPHSQTVASLQPGVHGMLSPRHSHKQDKVTITSRTASAGKAIIAQRGIPDGICCDSGETHPCYPKVTSSTTWDQPQSAEAKCLKARLL